MKYLKALIVGGVIVLVVVAGIYAVGARTKNGYKTVEATVSDIVKTVKVSGKVVAEESVDLGFESGGTIAIVYKKTGDTVRAGEPVAALDPSSVEANLLKAKAELSSAEAELESLQGAGALAKVQNAEQRVSQAIDEAYSTVDDAVRNKVDQFFANPRTANPEILSVFDDYALELSINRQRVSIEDMIRSWKAVKPSISKARENVSTVTLFLNDVSKAVNSFEPNNSLSQATIDGYKAAVAAARQNVNSSASSLLSAEEGLRSDRSDVPVLAARVEAARASVLAYESALIKTVIVSPISGVVSRQDAKVGQTATQGAIVTSIISDGFKIEAFVPEVSIAGINIGNTARVTLDAYGSDVVFMAIVTSIDPAETVRDGVSNYKIELAFGEPDQRIRSGMTANVTIETLRKSGVLTIPARSILSKDGSKIVLMKADADIVEREVVTGAYDSQGNAEIISGLVEGESVLLDPVAKK